MIDYPSRPTVNFYQAPSVSAQAMADLFLSLLNVLIDEEVLTEEAANRVFDNLVPLMQGVNNAHEIGLTINFWRRRLEWLRKQKRATSSNRAA